MSWSENIADWTQDDPDLEVWSRIKHLWTHFTAEKSEPGHETEYFAVVDEKK